MDMIKHLSRPIRSMVKHERLPSNTETKVYEFEGLSIPEKEIRKRWKYLAHHVITDHKKVILSLVNGKPCRKTPFNFCTKIEWTQAELKKKFPDGVRSDSWNNDELVSVPLGGYTINKKVVWERSEYRSVSEVPTDEKPKPSEKVLCYFLRKVNDMHNIKVHQEANRLVGEMRSIARVYGNLQGMTIYKNISHLPQDAPFYELIVEFTITPNTGHWLIPVLEHYNVNPDVGFTYGVYKRHQLISAVD